MPGSVRTLVSHRTRMAVLGAVAVTALVGLCIVPTAPPATGASESSGGASAVTRGHAQLAATSSPDQLRQAAAAGPAASHRRLPYLVPHNGSVSRDATSPSASAPTGAAAVHAAMGIQHNFDGLNALQNKQAAGFDLEPPDEGLGAGNNFVVNFVNVVGAIYRPSGQMLGSPFYLNAFFGEPDSANLSDPRVYYDSGAGRWYATMVEYVLKSDGITITESHVDLAVSRSRDPRGQWRVYQIPTSDLDHANCPCLADFPMLGFDQDNVYVSTAEFTSDEAHYNGAQIYAVSKQQVVNGAARPNVVHFHNLSVDQDLAGHVEPALTNGRSAAEYFVSSNDPNGTSGNQLAVWAITGARSVTTGNGSPRLSVRLISSERYTFPPNARTPVGFCSGDLCNNGKGAKTTGVLSTNDDEAQEVQFINGVLVTAVKTGIRPAGDGTTRSGAAWFVIRPAVSGGTVSGQTRVTRQGYVSKAYRYLLFPHVNMTPNGAMAMVFGLTGASTNPAAAYAVAPPGGPFGAVQVAASGKAAFHGFAGTPEYGGLARWGDYSNGQIIPGTQNVWLATQYVSGGGDGNENWANRIFQLNLS